MSQTVEQFDFSVNILNAILWQYNDATNLIAILQNKQNWLNEYQEAFWQNWYDDVFNLETADTFGLSVWSYILNIPLYIDQNPESDNKPIFGFNTVGLENSYLNFNRSNFSTKGEVFTLTVNQQRFLLRLKFFQLSTRGCIPDINAFLYYLCSTSNIGYAGTLYALDGLNMSMRYIFTQDDFPEELLQVILDLDLLPRPAGVKLEYYINGGFNWGFGVYNQNFTHGNFIDLLYT